MLNRASIKLEKLPMLMINQGTNTDSIFCTYTKYKAIRPSAKKKHIMTNAFIRAKTSMLLSMREQTVNISERKLDCDFNISTERDSYTTKNENIFKKNNQTKAKKTIKLKTLESIDSVMLSRKKKKNNVITITDKYLTEANDNGSIPYKCCYNNRSKISLSTLISFKK